MVIFFCLILDCLLEHRRLLFVSILYLTIKGCFDDLFVVKRFDLNE